MAHYEYKAVPAPHEGEATSANKTVEARLASAVETRLNAMAEEGWDYLRADAIPLPDGKSSHTVLIFRRSMDYGVFTEEKPDFGTFGDAAE